jgi:lipoprotein-releasing system permease protein
LIKAALPPIQSSPRLPRENRLSVPVPPRPFSVFEFMLAGRYLRARRKEGFISVIAGFSFLGILLGVATLIIVMSVMNGFRKELFDRILGFNGHFLVQPLDTPFTEYDALAATYARIPGVRQAIPFVDGQAFISGARQGSGVIVRGIRDEDALRIPSVSPNLRFGSLEQFSQSQGMALGRRLAANLGVQVGDIVTLISPRGTVTPFGQTPRVKPYPVVAIFEIGMSELDGVVAFLPIEEAQAFFNVPGRVSAIELYLDRPDDVDIIRPRINAATDQAVLVADWRQRNATFFGVLQVERNVMFMILTLIVLVAAFNIISGLVMLVKDKSSDIAILRTMGATRGAILRVFIMTGAAIGVAGTLGGMLLGVLVCTYIEEIRQFFSRLTQTDLFPAEFYFLSRLPAVMDPRDVMTVVGLALVLSLLATIYPAWKAAKLDPVEALRYE